MAALAGTRVHRAGILIEIQLRRTLDGGTPHQAPVGARASDYESRYGVIPTLFTRATNRASFRNRSNAGSVPIIAMM